MSIIIRLQNLPWSANALDIRQFFNGLQIPEGGVHIVGGELGDAFIAFSTDEDARQAFLRTDGKIKGIQVKLMLSSRTEMQRVIEQARNQSMAAFMLPSTAPVVQSVQVAAPLPAAVPPMLPAVVPEIKRDVKDRDESYSDKKKDRRRSRSRSKSRDRRDRSRDRRDRRHRDRSRSKSRDRRDRRRGRDRSKSRNRSRDRETRGSRRDKAKANEKREASPLQRDTKKLPDVWNTRPQIAQQSLNIIPPVQLAIDGPGILGRSPWGLEPAVKPPSLMSNLTSNPAGRGLNGFQGINPQGRDGGFRINSPNLTQGRSRDSWPPANPPSVRESYSRSPTDYPTAPVNNRGIREDFRGLRGPIENFRGLRGEMNNPNDNFRGPRVGMQNLRNEDDFRDPNDVIGDRRNARGDFHLPMEDLRMELNAKKMRPFENVNTRENNGKRSRFDDQESPVNACVSLEPFYGSYGDLRRFFNGLSINYRGIKVINDEFGYKTGVCLVQFRDASNKIEALKMNGRDLDSTEINIKHVTDKVFEEAVDRYNPRMENLKPKVSHLGRPTITKKLLPNEPVIKDFVSLKVEDLPTFVKEQDILHIFAQHPLISLHLNIKPKGGTVAYVKFSSKEVAKLALDEKSHHVIRGKPITVKPCTDEEFDEVNSQETEAFEESIKPEEDIDTDCLSLVNLPSKCNDRDISDLFSDIGLIPVKIHLMSTSMGFTGQAYCEFENKEEAMKAAEKNNTMLGQNTISVKLIARAEMEGILGETVQLPGVLPGQALAPGTPLPPIKPNIVPAAKQTVATPVAKPEAASPLEEKADAPEVNPDKLLTAQSEIEKPVSNTAPAEVNQSKMDISKLPSLVVKKPPPRPLLSDQTTFMRNRGDFKGRRFNDLAERPNDFDDNDFEDSRGFESDRLRFEGPRSFEEPRSFEGPRSFDGPRLPFSGNRLGPRGDFAGPRREFGPRGDFGEFGQRGGLGGSRFAPRGGSRFSQRRGESPETDELPGCTVYMENVPFKAGTNEILDFFEGYNCTNNVSRRYTAHNTPSPEAKVSFYNAEDAYRAVRELHGQKIWDRPIFLTQQ